MKKITAAYLTARRAVTNAFALFPRSRDYLVGLMLGAYVSSVHASIFGTKICSVFKSISGNDLYSVLAGLGLVGMLVANQLDEGDNKVKTAAIRVGIATTGLLNLETITTTLTGTGWGC